MQDVYVYVQNAVRASRICGLMFVMHFTVRHKLCTLCLQSLMKLLHQARHMHWRLLMKSLWERQLLQQKGLAACWKALPGDLDAHPHAYVLPFRANLAVGHLLSCHGKALCMASSAVAFYFVTDRKMRCWKRCWNDVAHQNAHWSVMTRHPLVFYKTKIPEGNSMPPPPPPSHCHNSHETSTLIHFHNTLHSKHVLGAFPKTGLVAPKMNPFH